MEVFFAFMPGTSTWLERVSQFRIRRLPRVPEQQVALRNDCEEASYRLLKDLQGDVVPKCSRSIQRSRANKADVTELLVGRNLTKATVGRQHIRHLRQALKFCYRELAQRGVCQLDPNPSNIMLVEFTGLVYPSLLLRMTFRGSWRNFATTESAGVDPGIYLVPLAVYAGFLWQTSVETWLLSIMCIIGVRTPLCAFYTFTNFFRVLDVL